MTTRCPWCQASIADDVSSADKCPECGGILQAVGGFRFAEPPADKSRVIHQKIKRKIASCPHCGHEMDVTGVADGDTIICPTAGCGTRLLHLSGVLARHEVPASKTDLHTMTRHQRLARFRRESGWAGTRRVFAALACLGTMGGAAVAIGGVVSLNAIGCGVGIATVASSIGTWLVVRLIADIADLLLGPPDDPR